jgi:hypothetical protein
MRRVSPRADIGRIENDIASWSSRSTHRIVCGHGIQFDRPDAVVAAILEVVIMHNDAVVQGLSEIPYMRDAER